MHYSDTVDESRQYLRLALEQIGKQGLPTDPVNYCVWYEYAAGNNEGLNSAIDMHLKTNGKFSGTITQQFFDRFIVDSKETLSLMVRHELKKIFSRIIDAIKATHRSFTGSDNNLDTISESLKPDLPEADVEKIVTQIQVEIQLLESTNASFRKQIEQANSEINQLKMKMERYRTEALKDPLTHILNRRGFEKQLKQAVEQSSASDSSLCLIIADIDLFKRINDTYGHIVGDNVLRMVADTITDYIKGRDMAARIGGEEFAILLPDTPLDGAMKLADDIRIAFERLEFKKRVTGESLGKITLSFGVASYKKSENTKNFVNRADKALYKSKNNGRNKVTGF